MKAVKTNLFCIIQLKDPFELFANDSSGKYKEINKISLSYETKLRKVT